MMEYVVGQMSRSSGGEVAFSAAPLCLVGAFRRFLYPLQLLG
jgi:hypothetical protein